ncbi:uncharacterized protein LOC130623958 [Hydractinia symbiolongicarpus]|uniref:uncharacterized protein LOC130623958 n=1 Tax=Hydractinia symbiolongicarpus TaxID=13093 RepID=UPI00254E7F4B|nr:uncharacterized protein LOC130623958 [Hydractinia symbiolongicarpus]
MKVILLLAMLASACILCKGDPRYRRAYNNGYADAQAHAENAPAPCILCKGDPTYQKAFNAGYADAACILCKGDPMYREGYIAGYSDSQASIEDTPTRRNALLEDSGAYGNPVRICYTSWKDCSGCRGYLDTCCSDKNCGGGRRCKRGLSVYSCDN